MSFDDFFGRAGFGPVGQVATAAFVEHLGRGGHGAHQLLGLFVAFVLALGDDFGFATVDAAVHELAARFQGLFRGWHALSGGSIALSNEFAQLGGQRSAFGVARFRGRLAHISQAANAGFEVFIAAQLEQAQEFLDTFAFWRFGARVDTGFSLGGDRAHFCPGFSVSEGRWRSGSARNVVLDEGAHFGAAFRSGHLIWRQVAELSITSHLGLDGFPARVQARVVTFLVFGEDATKSSQ